MVLAAPRDDFYNVLLFVHIAALLVGFAPVVLGPLVANYLRREGEDRGLRSWAGFSAFYTSRVSNGSLVVLLVTGIWMILISDVGDDQLYEFSQTWISLAFLVWLALGGVLGAMILKGQKGIASGDTGKEQLVARGALIANLLLALMLYLMIFKPGL